MSDDLIHGSDASFDAEVLKAEIPVLVDFWAPWCGPCLMIAPVMDEIATAQKGKLKVVKINVDESAKTAEKYGIMAIPTLILFKGGEIKDLSFGSYEITRFSWVPKIETVLIDNPELASQGGGEPPITCMGGLIANALFDAVGVRLNRLPLTPDRIKAQKPV